jgi:hypothetical protein
LIEQLARQTRPVPRRSLEGRLAAGAIAGAGISTALIVAGLGLRPDLGSALAGSAFWAKAAYTSTLGAAGLLLTAQLARPECRRPRFAWLLAVPIGAALLLAGAELARVGTAERADLFLTPGWSCLPLLLLLSVPIYLGLIWALRRMAPTRLGWAGGAAGLSAAGLAATLYALYCQQISPTYVLTRYTLAVGLAALAGAAVGRRLLRW